MPFRYLAALVLSCYALAGAETTSGITKITPVIYDHAHVKSFLAEFLSLTESQMVQSDLAFAEARAKLYPLSEKLKQTQTALDQALTQGSPVLQWKPLVTTIANLQAQMMALECVALEKFRTLLDGDQRHRLGKLSQLSMTTNPKGEPVLAYSVEQ
jgi:hypothetical protein